MWCTHHPVVSTEAELVAALEGEGRATVAAGVTIELTKGLLVSENPPGWDYDCENAHSIDSSCVGVVSSI